jgi:hypothetical protein
MDSPDQADREEQLADVQEGTEQQMHSYRLQDALAQARSRRSTQ